MGKEVHFTYKADWDRSNSLGSFKVVLQEAKGLVWFGFVLCLYSVAVLLLCVMKDSSKNMHRKFQKYSLCFLFNIASPTSAERTFSISSVT